ncbi:LutC/YkgG family protein [Rhizomonospora bruguierae]|uniref:LutC/YkgG family protein n=1 Tax=Rhizomonospora bruguierae TaxID=1581705 RepID=UPI001BD1250C|nr:LUD domain-containing protein [Micromonospora sp. NBRC 107566]
MNARDEILSRIRRALTAAPPATAAPATAAPAGAVSGAALVGAGAAGSGDVIALLADRLVDYKANVRHCPAGSVGSVVGELLAGATAVATPPDIPADWLSAWTGTVLRDGAPEPLTVARLDAPGVAALTGCAVAIAETGTLILDTGPVQGRRVLTLVPDHHICVVPASRVVAGVPAGFAALPDPSRPITLVSGPSATSDIELDRVEGVHGPRRLDVVIVVDAQ